MVVGSQARLCYSVQERWVGFSEPRGLLAWWESAGRQDRRVERGAEALVRRGRDVILRAWGRGWGS